VAAVGETAAVAGTVAPGRVVVAVPAVSTATDG
jgi:hypothetical protein